MRQDGEDVQKVLSNAIQKGVLEQFGSTATAEHIGELPSDTPPAEQFARAMQSTGFRICETLAELLLEAAPHVRANVQRPAWARQITEVRDKLSLVIETLER